MFVGHLVISSSFSVRNEIQNSKEESDIGAKKNSGTIAKRNCFGEAKTSHYKRPVREKKVLEDREKVATRRSWHIQQMIEDKKKLDKVITIYF